MMLDLSPKKRDSFVGGMHGNIGIKYINERTEAESYQERITEG